MKRLLPAALGLTLAAHALADVSYTLTPDPGARTFGVRMELTPKNPVETLRIPAWSPGFYFLQDYARKISALRATDLSGAELAVARKGGAWTVANPARTPITVSYRVLADDKGLGFFGAHLRETSGFVNGPSTFLYADGRKDEPCALRVRNPEGWDTATPMTPDGPDRYKAGGYDEFIDMPLQLGVFTRKAYEVDGIPFEAIWVPGKGPIQANLDAETERLRRGSIPALKLFGGASFRRYMTIIHLEVGDFSGGLEHRACNVQAVPNAPTLHLDDLATHEYFHAWNVKQIRPLALGPFDYTQKVRTANLWFSEGVTDYYAKLTAYRAGLKGPEWLLDSLGSAIEETAQSRTEKTITLEQCSERAWENGGFGVGDLSYYTKGLVCGFVFDAYLRGRSDGKVSLDDVMRALYARHALPKPGFAEDELRATLVEFGGAGIGPLYDRLVRTAGGGVPTDVADGIGLRILAPGVAFAKPRFQTDDKGLVTAVGNPGDAVRVGDRIVSLVRKGQSLGEATVERGGRTLTLEAPLFVTTVADYRVEPNPFATAEQKARRAAWYGTPLAPLGD